MRELNVNEVEQVSAGLDPEKGAMIEGLIASAAFGMSMTGVGLIATGAAILCIAMIDDISLS
jgi:hypothetical protein